MPEEFRTAYTYERFSSPKQKKGNSSARQNENITKWLAKHPEFRLAKDSAYSDFGKSGRGEHLQAELGRFLALVHAGKIKPGSALLIENWDRLGRMTEFEMFGLFYPMAMAGITVVTTMDGKMFNREWLNSPEGRRGMMEMMESVGRARDESETKAVRSNDNWNRVRANAKNDASKARLPAWLRAPDRGGPAEVIPERGKIVLWMFERLKAGLGTDRIAEDLEARGIEPWGKGDQKARCWHGTYISKILSNPAVVGSFQWHSLRYDQVKRRKVREPIGPVIPDHFPPVVPQALYDEVQAIRRSRAKRRGAIGAKVRNLFTGLAWCGHTGFPMIFSNKNPRFYLKSAARKAPEGVKLKPWLYEQFETAVFDFFGRIDTTNLQDPLDAPLIEEIKEKIAKENAMVERLSTSIKNVIRLTGKGDLKDLDEAQDQLAEYRAERDEAKQRIKKLESDLAKLTTEVEATTKALEGIALIRGKRKDPAFRLRLRDELAKLVEGIFVYLDARSFQTQLGVAVTADMMAQIILKNAPDERMGALDALTASLRKDRIADTEPHQVKVRGFVVVFKDGSCRRVIVDAEPGVLMKGNRWKAKGRIVREGKLAKLVDLTMEGGSIYGEEGNSNLWWPDFGTKEEFDEYMANEHQRQTARVQISALT